MTKGGQGMNKYTTISGDMWDGIAYKQMGNEKYMDILIKNNLKYRHVVVFSAGVVLNIPEVQEEVSMQLPPWKRGLV